MVKEFNIEDMVLMASTCKTCLKGLDCKEHELERKDARNIDKIQGNMID